MREDVDGDRRTDHVSLVGRWRDGVGCSYRLAVRTANGTHSLLLREGFLEPEVDVDPTAKHVLGFYGLAKIDRRPGNEILILFDVWGGRSAVVGIYSLVSGRIRHLPIAGRRYQDAMFSGGGAAHYRHVSDCWRGAGSGLVISTAVDATFSAGVPEVSRALYRLERDAFRLVWRRSYRRTPKHFPELVVEPGRWPVFRSCMTRLASST